MPRGQYERGWRLLPPSKRRSLSPGDAFLPLPLRGSTRARVVREADRGARFGSGASQRRLQVRIGIHTGLVVIGEIGSSEKREMLALGETPNIAARIQGQASPDEVVISAATRRLVQGVFEYQDLGAQLLKGVTAPLTLYRVVRESAAQSRFEAATQAGLTPLVGREHEIAMLLERWQLAQDTEGQVVLLSGEPGIGKSRIVSVLLERLEGQKV